MFSQNNKLIDSIVKNRKSSKDAYIINDPKDTKNGIARQNHKKC